MPSAHHQTWRCRFARRAVAIGLYVSFSGVITFKDAPARSRLKHRDRVLVDRRHSRLSLSGQTQSRPTPFTLPAALARQSVADAEIASGPREFTASMPAPFLAGKPQHERQADARYRIIGRRATARPALGCLRSELIEESAPAVCCAGRHFRPPAHTDADRYPAGLARAAWPRSIRSMASSSPTTTPTTHGIDDLRMLAYNAKRRVDVHFDVATRTRRFSYCFNRRPACMRRSSQGM